MKMKNEYYGIFKTPSSHRVTSQNHIIEIAMDHIHTMCKNESIPYLFTLSSHNTFAFTKYLCNVGSVGTCPKKL